MSTCLFCVQIGLFCVRIGLVCTLKRVFGFWRHNVQLARSQRLTAHALSLPSARARARAFRAEIVDGGGGIAIQGRHLIKETYLKSKEIYPHTKETCSHTQETYSHTKETYSHTLGGID